MVRSLTTRSNFGRFSYPLRIKGLWQILWSKNGPFLPKIGKLGGGSRKYPLNVLKSKGNFRVLSQMASDSEGLRQKKNNQPVFSHLFVANGFRFGRVTTTRLHPLVRANHRRKWLPIRKGYDSWKIEILY